MRGDRLARFVAEHGFALVVLTVLCGLLIGANCRREKDTPTTPDPVPEAVATPSPVVIEPVVIEPTPEGGRGSNPGPTSAEIEKNCSALLTNTGRAPHGVNIRYTAPLNESIVHLARLVVVPAKGTANVSAAQAYFEGHYLWGEEECDFGREVQCDFTAGQGEHLGGRFANISIHNPQCDECVPGEWRESGPRSTDDPPWDGCLQASATDEECFECRTLTTTISEFNGCERRTRTTTEDVRREIECPECVDTPGGTVAVDASGNPLRASASFSDSGTWRLRIKAASRKSECEGDDPDFVKRSVTKSLECDQAGTLSTSYSWHGHGSDWWWATLERNGSQVDRTECIRNPTD